MSKTNNELVCIGELMEDGFSGFHLRGKYESNCNWYGRLFSFKARRI